MATEFDVICVGAGPCGEALAAGLEGSGLSLAVIEANLVGGECPYWGCMPSKTMIRSAEVLAEAVRARELAASRLDFDADFGKASRRVHWMARDLNDAGAAESLQKLGATLIRGTARLTGPRQVTVDGGVLTARQAVVIASGTRPSVPPIPGLDGVAYWTNREAVLAAELPPSLAVIGGGAIGVELAQAYARFGTKVTVIQVADRLVHLEEPEVGPLLSQALVADGIEVLTGAGISGVEQAGGEISIGIEGRAAVTAGKLLVATGRSANIESSEAEAAGLTMDKHGFVQVDPRTLAAAEGVYAGGDVNGLFGFTHVSHYHGTLIARAIRGLPARADHRAIPRVTFTDPEIASVGLSEAKAREQGIDVAVATADVPHTSRGYIHDAKVGLIKVIADRSLKTVVGATVVSPRAGEIIQELVLAVRAEVPIPLLRDTIHGFPTFTRPLQGIFDDLS